MTNKTKKQPTIKLTIAAGTVSPAVKASWAKFWQKLIAETKGDDDAKKKDD
jgi:hypothetical protein